MAQKLRGRGIAQIPRRSTGSTAASTQASQWSGSTTWPELLQASRFLPLRVAFLTGRRNSDNQARALEMIGT